MNGRVVKLQLWDTAGQERYRTITSSYYRGAQGIFVAYDITSRESFNSIPRWLDEVTRYGTANVSLMVLGLKADLAMERRAVDENEGRELAAVRDTGFFECSSKANVNIVESVLTLCRMIG
jgi:small GTP-binding protein